MWLDVLAQLELWRCSKDFRALLSCSEEDFQGQAAFSSGELGSRLLLTRASRDKQTEAR